MSNKVITLDSIRESVSSKFAHTEIDLGAGEPVILLNALRLPKEVRQRLSALQDLEFESDDLEETLAAQEETFREIIRTVAETPQAAERLLKVVDESSSGDSLALLLTIVSEYQGSQGEASPSGN